MIVLLFALLGGESVLAQDSYEPDNTSGQAIAISSGQTQQHSLIPAGEADWLTFSVAAESIVEFKVFGAFGPNEKPDIFIYDNGLNEISFAQGDSNGFIGLVSSRSSLSAGTYFVRVQDVYPLFFDIPLVDYSLVITPLASDVYESDNTSATATLLTAGTWQPGHSIYPSGEEDWVRFTLPQQSNIVMETRNALPDKPYFQLYNGSLSAISSSSQRHARNLSAGTYYAQFFGASPIANYDVLLSATPGTPRTKHFVFDRMWPSLQQPWYFRDIRGLDIDAQGHVWIADSGNGLVHQFSFDGNLISSLKVGDSLNAQDVAVATDGSFYVLSNNGGVVTKFTAESEASISWDVSRGSTHNQQWDVETDSEGHVYVLDIYENRVMIFSGDGDFIEQWPVAANARQMASTPDGFIYVILGNDEIWKYAPHGETMFSWGVSGDGDGQFRTPEGIALGSTGLVYINDANSDRIQVFRDTGTGLAFERKIQQPGGKGVLAVDLQERIFLATFNGTPTPSSIAVFSPPPETLSNLWTSAGTDEGLYRLPVSIATEAGNVHVGHNYARIKVTSNVGQFQRSVDVDAGINFMLLNDAGDYYLLPNSSNNRIARYSSLGIFQEEIGTYSSGTGIGQIKRIDDAVRDSAGNFYIGDNSDNCRVTKLAPDGSFLLHVGSPGNGDGQIRPSAQNFRVAVDGSGNIYVLASDSIQKYSPAGVFLTEWEAQVWQVGDLATDSENNVYVASYGPQAGMGDAIFVYSPDGELLDTVAGSGTGPGAVSTPMGLTAGADGKLYVADTGNNRVQVFKDVPVASKSRAVIVSAGGAFAGNNLWASTQLSANFAFRSLLFKGFTKSSIQYLSSNQNLDLDGNGVKDEVDADATNATLENALTTWALADGTEEVVVYLVDHGGAGTFRMSATETLEATQLDAWLDTLENALVANNPNAKLTVVYDACESGTFSPVLTSSANRRIVITSTSPNESAYFLSQGTISFSVYFWTYVFNGSTVKTAFDLAKAGMQQAIGKQTPILTDPAALAPATYVGNGTVIVGQVPTIGSVVGAQSINSSTATLWADPVTDPDGIARVWATIRPPTFVQGASTNPITELPSIDLLPTTGNRYEQAYTKFNAPGLYQIAIYSRDRLGNVSAPKLTTVAVNSPLHRKAIIVAGGALTDPLWPATENSVARAYSALKVQGYTDAEIAFRSPVVFSASVDGLPSLANLEYLIKTWAVDAADLVLYMVGNGSQGTFQIGPSETLTASSLDGWLDTLQATPSIGTVMVVYDGDQSGSFITQMAPPANKQRAVLCSALTAQPAHFLSGGDISFSSYFWTRVLNGATVRTAFKHAEVAMRFAGHGQQAILDDNGNGIGGEKGDSILVNLYAIGAGIQLAGDDPVIGSITVTPASLSSGTTATIRVDNVTTTGQISQVLATVSSPDGASTVPVLVPLTETPPGSGSYQASYNGFAGYGFHTVSVVAIDVDGNTSIPMHTEVMQQDDALGDAYEVDDTLAQAKWIDDAQVQTHNFHDAGDEDWIRFTADVNEQVTIETFGLGAGADTQIELYRSNGTVIPGTLDDDSHPDYFRGERFVFQPSNFGLGTGEYYLRVRFAPGSPLSPSFGPNTYYKARIFREIGTGETANFSVVVQDAAGVGIASAALTLQLQGSSGCPVGLSPCPYPAARLAAATNPNLYTFLTVPVNNTYTMNVSAPGFVAVNLNVVVPNGARNDPNFNPVGTVVLQSSVAAASPLIEATPTSLEFGNIGVGVSLDKTLVVKNSGSGTLSGSASVAAPFTIVGTAAYSLGSGQQQTITVRFTPTASSPDAPSTYVSLTGGGGRQVPVSGFTGMVWMDFAWAGQALGTFDNPYTSFAQSVPAVATNGLIRIKSSMSLTAVTINKAMRIEAYGGLVRIGTGGGRFAPDTPTDPSTKDDLTTVVRQMLTSAAESPSEASSDSEIQEGQTEISDAMSSAASNSIREGYTFEAVMPYTRLADERVRATGDTPLALRLRAEHGILTSSLWQDIQALEATRSLVTWQHAQGQAPDDLWVLFRPIGRWTEGDKIRVATGATTQVGDLVEVHKRTFVVRTPAETQGEFVQLHDPAGDPAQIATVVAGSALTTGVPGGLDQPYTIGPERVFDQPQWVWLPLPDGWAREDLQLYYYHPYGDDAGWYPVEQVIGWLNPGPEQLFERAGACYLGIHVQHAATVQFAASTNR